MLRSPSAATLEAPKLGSGRREGGETHCGGECLLMTLEVFLLRKINKRPSYFD